MAAAAGRPLEGVRIISVEQYGAGPHGMLQLADRERLQVVIDQSGRPTYAGDIATVIGRFISDWQQGNPPAEGCYHCASSGVVTWYEFATAIFERASGSGMIERVPELLGIDTDEYPTAAERPRYSVLDTTKLERYLGSELPEWRLGLEQTLSALRAAS